MSNSTDSPTRSADSYSEEVVCDGYAMMEGVPPSSDKHVIQVNSMNIKQRPVNIGTKKSRVIQTDSDDIKSNEISTTPNQSHQISDDATSNSSLHVSRSSMLHKSNSSIVSSNKVESSSSSTSSSSVGNSSNNFYMSQQPAHTLPHSTPLSHPSNNSTTTNNNFHSLNTQQLNAPSSHEQQLPSLQTNSATMDSHNLFYHHSTNSSINQLSLNNTSSNNFFTQTHNTSNYQQHTLSSQLHNTPLTSSQIHSHIPPPSLQHSITSRSGSPRSVSPNHNSPSSSPRRRSPRTIQTDSDNIIPAVIPRLIQTDSNIVTDEPSHTTLNGGDRVVPSSTMGDIHMSNNDSSASQNNFYLSSHQNRREIGLLKMTPFIELVIKNIPNKWQDFGRSIGIPLPALDDIERKYLGQNSFASFTEVYKYWENHKNELKPFLWKTVDDILSDPLFECPMFVMESIRKEYMSLDGRNGSGSPDYYPRSLPGRLNEQPQQCGQSTAPPPPHLSSLDLHIPSNNDSGNNSVTTSTSTRKHYTPATNVLPSPNLPYDIQEQLPQRSNSTGNFTSSQTGNFYSSSSSAGNGFMQSLAGRGGEPLGGLQQSMLPTPYSLIQQGNPSVLQENSSVLQGNPSLMQGNPSLMQGNPNVMQGNPNVMQGNSSVLQGNPSLMQGNPNVMQENPNVMQGNPSLMQGNPSLLQVNPNVMHGNSNVMQGTPGFYGSSQLRPPSSQAMHSPHPQLKETLPQVMQDPYYQLGHSNSIPSLQPPVPQMIRPSLGNTYSMGYHSQIPDDPYSLLDSSNNSPSISDPNITGSNISGSNITSSNIPGPNISGPIITPPNILGPNIPGPIIPAPNITGNIPPPYNTPSIPHSITPTYSTTTNTNTTTSTTAGGLSSPTTNNTLLLTGYTVIAPVSAATTPSSSQMITLSSSQQPSTTNSDKDKSTSSTFYSATEAESFNTSEVVVSPKDPWIKLVQKYMQKLEQKPVLSQPAPQRPIHNSNRSRSPQRHHHRANRNKKDDTSLLQKELEKSYERISSLEVRVQDLTSQVSSDIPDDKDLSLLSKEKLEQEFKRMRELKKKAELQNVESRQTAQRLITENCRLKEELSQSKNECDMLLGELRSLKRKMVATEKLKEVKVEAMKKSLKESVEINLKDLDLTPIANPLTSEVSDYPTEEFTPKLLLDAINTSENQSVLTVGQVGVVGLPSSGKTSLLKGLLKNEIGDLTKPKGQDTCIEFYEVMSARNPLTGDSQWKMSSGIDTAVQYLASITAQYYYRRKRSPSFNTSSNQSQSFARLFLDLTDSQMKATLEEIYKRVHALLQEEKKRDSMTQLALFQSVFMNIWDVGVNLCLYQFLPIVAGHCEHLVLLNVLDLERDVPNFDDPPNMTQKDSYRTRGDSDNIMRVYGRQVYFMLMSGLKRWFNKKPPNLVAPEVLIVGTYTKELKQDAIENLIRNLKAHLTALCLEFDIEGAIDMTILTYCIDGNKKLRDKELSLIKAKLEKVMAAQPNFMEPFDPKWMLFRSLYYNPSSLAVSLEELKRVGRSCGIVSHDRLNECLSTFKNVGSVLYGPSIETAVTQSHVIIDIPRIFELLDRLFYFNYYQSSYSSNTSLSTDTMEEYRYGLISMTLAEKVFTRQEASLCLEYLMACKVCVEVKSRDKKTTMCFLPSLRKDKRLLTSYNKDSLYIQYHCHYSQCDQLILFHKFANEIFNDSDTESFDFEAYLEYNVTGISYTNEQEGVKAKIEVIYYPKIIEIRVIPLTTTQDDKEKDEKQSTNNSTSLSLYTKILNLCQKVYSEVCKDIQNLKYEFSLLCPNSCHDDLQEAHFVKFYTDYRSDSLHCQKCGTDVKFNDNRVSWLASQKNTS